MAADYAISVRFGDPILEHGFTTVPTLFLEHYADLGMTTNEAMFVIQLFSFWWGIPCPYPRLNTVAKRMGYS